MVFTVKVSNSPVPLRRPLANEAKGSDINTPRRRRTASSTNDDSSICFLATRASTETVHLTRVQATATICPSHRRGTASPDATTTLPLGTDYVWKDGTPTSLYLKEPKENRHGAETRWRPDTRHIALATLDGRTAARAIKVSRGDTAKAIVHARGITATSI
jgi:hypothetical protein